MMPITGVNAAPFAYTAREAGWVNRLLGMAAGVASLVFALAATDKARCERTVPYVRDDCFGRCSFGKLC